MLTAAAGLATLALLALRQRVHTTIRMLHEACTVLSFTPSIPITCLAFVALFCILATMCGSVVFSLTFVGECHADAAGVRQWRQAKWAELAQLFCILMSLWLLSVCATVQEAMVSGATAIDFFFRCGNPAPVCVCVCLCTHVHRSPARPHSLMHSTTAAIAHGSARPCPRCWRCAGR